MNDGLEKHKFTQKEIKRNHFVLENVLMDFCQEISDV